MKHAFSGLIKTTLVSAIAVALISCGGAEERKVKYLEKGKAYIEEQNFDKAKIEIKNVLQIDPKFAEAHYVMGQINEQDKELRKAIGNYSKAIELDPQHIGAKVGLAKIYVIAGTEEYLNKARQLLAEVKNEASDTPEADLISATIDYKTGDKEKATKSLEIVVKNNPKMVEGISLLSTIYMAGDRDDAAILLLKKGVKDNASNIHLRTKLAQILAKNRDYVSAEKYLKQAIEIEPERYTLQVTLSSFYASTNQVEKAVAILKDAIKQDPADTQRYLVLVEVLSSHVGVKQAEETLLDFIKQNPDMYELKMAQVKLYEKLGKRDELKAVLNKIISEHEYDIEAVEARTQLANYLLEEGDQAGARKHVDIVLAEYPNNNAALLVAAKLDMMNLQAVSAINRLRTVVKNDPKNAEASALLARAHETNNESSLAENELRKAIEANPVNNQVHVNYAGYLVSKGRTDEALDIVDKALTYFDNDYELLKVKLKILASQQKNDELPAVLNRMEAAEPSLAEVNTTRAQLYLSNGEVDKALEQFELAYEKSVEKYKPLENIVKVYVSNDQPDKALARLQKRFDVDPDDSIANYLVGHVLLSQNKPGEARSKFREAANESSEWFPPYYGMAVSYLSENNIDKAIEAYKEAVENLKVKTPAQMQLASLYERKQAYTDAMDVYKQILQENPANQVAANNYAALLLDYGNPSDIATALEVSKGFEKLQQPAFQDTLAWAYAKSGDHQKAIDILMPIVERASNVAVFRYHLGYALYHSGDKAAAKSHLEIAVDSEQDFPGKIEAEALFKEI